MKMKKGYNPLYFLSALGSGGLSVSFFMYLQFMVPHKKDPMVRYEHLMVILEKMDYRAALIVLILLAIVFFAVNHYILLVKNIIWFREYKKSEAYTELKLSDKALSLMTIPLTFAMSMNIILIMGALFIPGIWVYIEYLFPVVILGFMIIGGYALSIFGSIMTGYIVNGSKGFIATNNLSQLITAFAFSMIAVGFAAPGAMSHNIIMNSIGIFFAILFLSLTAVVGGMKLIFGFKSILENGISKEASPTFWLIIPIMTLVGITLIRLLFGLDHHYDDQLAKSSLFVVSSIIISIQVLNGVLGYSVMKKLNYFKEFIAGDKKSSGSFSLICPGVALFVFGMFFIHFGIIKNSIVVKYSVFYFLMIVPFALIQVKTITVFFKVSNKLIKN